MASQEDLIPGETVLVAVLRHPVVLVRRCWLAILVGLVALAGGGLVSLAPNLTTLRWFAVLGIELLVLVYLDLQYIGWRAQTYTVTNHRVLLRRGVMSKYTKSISLNRVQDVTTGQGVFGRLFGYGTLELESAGKDGAEVLTYIPAPDVFRNAIIQELHPQGTAPAAI